MSFGKLYGTDNNPRVLSLQAIAKENGLDVEFVQVKIGADATSDYRKLNKMGKCPTFEGKDGYILSELIAIAIYFTSQNEKTSLLGKTKQDYASILRWISFASMEGLPSIAQWVGPVVGKMPYNKKNVETAQEKANAVLKTYEDHLLINTYLVGERLTLADIMSAFLLSRAFELVLDRAWRTENPNVSRWFETIANQPIYKAVISEQKFADKAVVYTPPAKEKAPKQEKKEAPKQEKKPKAVAEDDDDEPPPAPKAKHPLEELGKASMPIDEWKRKFKNEETREVALPWFWESMPWEEYSIWQIDFKYNEELTMTFMSNNQVGGFFTRLEGSRKYIMGCASVYGQTNDSVIKGAFVIRGQDSTPAFDVAPDWESYDYKKLDPKSAADKKFVESMWAWDEPVEVGGKKYEWADGKIFV